MGFNLGFKVLIQDLKSIQHVVLEPELNCMSTNYSRSSMGRQCSFPRKHMLLCDS